MINISISKVNMLNNSSTLTLPVPINLSIRLGFVSVNGPEKLTLWMSYVFIGIINEKIREYRASIDV